MGSISMVYDGAVEGQSKTSQANHLELRENIWGMPN